MRGRVAAVAMLVAAACAGGDDSAGPIDASAPATDGPAPDAPAIDAAPPPDAAVGPDAPAVADAAPVPDAGASAACLVFETPARVVSTYPATGMGNINAGTAVVNVAADACTDVQAPLGVNAPGQEQITKLTNLAAGTTYRVRIEGESDLALYVATSCTGAIGPGPGECLLYVDTLALTEVATFTQPTFVAPEDGVAYLVVDYFSTTPPSDGRYAFDVREVECATSFDCPSVDAPVCSDFACVPGPAACITNEDPSPPENGDDGPAGATVLARDELITAAVCDADPLESDFYRFAATAGEVLVVDVDWSSSTTDLDVVVFDAAGVEVARGAGSSRPEAVVLNVPATGDYVVRAFQFAGLGTPTTAIPYTIDVHARECTWSGDCLDPALPRCTADLRCAAGPFSCVGDDAVEDGDDGPVGATDVAATPGGGPVSIDASICNFPTEGSAGSIERDFYEVAVGDGETLSVSLSWIGVDDLDVEVFDAIGAQLGFAGTAASPESLTVPGLVAGTYYVAVRKSAPVTTSSTPYSLSIERSGP